MPMTKRREGVHRHSVSPTHPPERYEIRFKGSLIGHTQRVKPKSRAFWAEPNDGRPWQRFQKHIGAEEYLAGLYEPQASQGFGQPFQQADESIEVAARDPFGVDPDIVNRGNRGHAQTLNALAKYVQDHGDEPLSPAPLSGDFLSDLAWLHGNVCFVAEVKSLTKVNQEHQLRLGMGQLLRYRHYLLQRFESVVPVLAVEWQPEDAAWSELCNGLGVRLVWPPKFEDLEGYAKFSLSRSTILGTAGQLSEPRSRWGVLHKPP